MNRFFKSVSLLSLCLCLLLTSACSSKKSASTPEPDTGNEEDGTTSPEDGSLTDPLSQPLSAPLSAPLDPVGNGIQAKVDVIAKKFALHTDRVQGREATTLLISGTVRNDEDTPAVCNRLKGTAFDSSNTAIGSGDASGYLEVIPAEGESKFAFSVQLPEDILGQNVMTIKVEPTCEHNAEQTPPQPSDPSLVQFTAKHIEINTSLTDGPTAILTGIVQNISTSNLEFSSASGSIFDSSGLLLGKQKGIVYPAVLAPGANGYIALEFEIADTMKLTDITRQWFDFNYFVTSSSTEYFTIPESHRSTEDMTVWDITGSIEKPTGDTVTPTALILLYNRSDQLIDVDLGHTTSSSTPRAIVSFQASTPRLLDLIDHYEVLAFSDKQ
ncbi:hypothetical protein AUK40_05125 [Candidatus Wirthbacteria bacterium CG2_30_54_11]|uniref:DUF4352 domain-containing protein n=1 Tax=Candidatus Wirthbacteria bacterium CG2_30_54_11 TaxID=1817892 RepID=A0A1J5IT03_9BACT|nr:MAG: hypothetical protein AUK40_05125 [Candidatus Wirthbacteria bacterium CG2_30_54_11]